jgi:GntR family transcriptional regulator
VKIEFNENSPIYIQIVSLIKRRILSGELNPGDKLPSVRELSAQLRVNPNTIQRTYQELERADLAFTQRGMGRFVTEKEEVIDNMKKDMAEQIMETFLKGMRELGFKKEDIVTMVSEAIRKEKI